MSPYLLDVNVIIALLDPEHENHERAHAWFDRGGSGAWLSCPTTQNGVLRIVTNPRYSNTQPMAVVIDSLASLVLTPGHTFVADSVTLLGSQTDSGRLVASGQVTDTYLLALAVKNEASLATFDRRLVTAAVRGGANALHVIGRPGQASSPSAR